MNAVVSGTKGQFNCEAYFGGLDFKFGTGGLHASVSHKTYKSDSDYMIYDIDVKSLYPSIAIEYGYYPEHLGEKFVDVYRSLREQRFNTKKGTPENAMLKLALNGVYGASSDIFSVFYDPLFTMRITVGGQLLIAMLAEQLVTQSHGAVELIQVNTDGITMRIPRAHKETIDATCSRWEEHTKLELEKVEYETMAIADVNSYLAIDTDGNIKRKGRYEHDVEWHQDASALVIAKVAEQAIVNGLPIRETVRNWPDKMDFMLRVKVPRSSKLVGRTKQFDIPLENVQRYYVAREGVELIKIMPPLPKKPGVEREFLLNENKVWPCNDMKQAFIEDNINYYWYITEVEKLVSGVEE